LIMISYDIQDDKIRTKFSKFIRKFGHRIQLSVYEIDNCSRVLDNIIAEIKNRFMSLFSEADSVLILNLSSSCEVIRMGYEVHEETDLIMV
jgi:CRISPR-associated endoribonuclease Cas2